MRILCNAKDSHIFSTKNNSVVVIFMFEILTDCYLTTSLILNNWAQVLQIRSWASPVCRMRLGTEVLDMTLAVGGM